MDKVQIYVAQFSLSAVIAAVTQKWGALFWLLIVFTVAMVLDFLSGMMASATESLDHPGDSSYGWSSKKGLQGILKKSGYILIVLVAMMVDFLVYKMSGVMQITPPTMTFFTMLVTAWFILNECLSIIENAGRMGVKSIPVFLTKIIAVLKGTVEDTGKHVVQDKEESEE